MSPKAIIDPATGEVAAELKRDNVTDLVAVVRRTREAQVHWGALSIRERARRLLPLRRIISDRQDELAHLINRTSGKTRSDAVAGDIAPGAMAVAWYARRAHRFLKPRRVGPGHVFFFFKRSTLVREPLGVVGIISPWNYPFGIPIHETAMALAAGNAVVLKPATQCQPVADLMVELIDAAGIPEGLFQVIHLPGKTAGPAFLDAGIDKLMFTGSVPVGKELAAAAGERLLPVGLELGGNDAMVVLSDAVLERAAAGAVWGGLSNAGQSCGGVERIIVEAPAYEEFRNRLIEKVKRLRVGPDVEHDVDISCLNNAGQKKTVEAHVADALSKGARIIAESNPPQTHGSDLFHRAVLLEGVTTEMDVIRHETFGPVLTLEKAEDEDDAVRRANDSYLGLSSSVWTTSRRRGRRVALRIEAGSVGINDHLMQHGMAEIPWGGYKMSSLGRTHGRLGLESMTKPKVIVEDRFPRAPRQIWWHPNSPKAYRTVSGITPFLYGPRRLRALGQLFGPFLKGLFQGE